MEMPLMTATPAHDTPDAAAPDQAARQHWIGVLARSRRAELLAHEAALRDADYQLIRAPEIGMALVRGRMGGSGAPFNVGEMTVTRCVVRLADGRTGFSYLAGRDKAHAELAALADAHLQGARRAHWINDLIDPLARAHDLRRAQQHAETAATKVEFFTLVRGEN
jgi:alpha-D-ribose 1-methylphosphonate 5-triphosphate synthase subunit PhnG